VLNYENRNEAHFKQLLPQTIDIEMIEAVVRRLLKGSAEESAASEKKKPRAQKTITEKSVPYTDDLRYDGAMDALGHDGLDAIAVALDAFRKI
jgi:hypothetical protein